MEIKLYQAVDANCSYLSDKHSSSLVVDPELPITQELTSGLSQLGFRRSGHMLYRPNCETCNACKSSRIRIAEFKPSKSQKRILNKGKDFECQVRGTDFQDEDYQLYEKYITERHSDGDMYPPEPKQYQSFLCGELGFSYFLEIRKDQKLVAVCQFDALYDGLSAVYTFFDPAYESYSLGTLAVLQLIHLCKTANLPYLYLGYYIENCDKMNYKRKYQPLEVFEGDQWIKFEDLPA